MAMSEGKPPYPRSILSLVHSADSWDKTLSQLGLSHPLQSWSWGAFKERWGWQAIPLSLAIGDQPVDAPPMAAAMILKRRARLTPFSILYVPKGPLLDFSKPALRRVVLAQLEQIARLEKAIFVKIDPDVVIGWGEDDDRLSPIGAKFREELEARGWLFSQEQVQFRNTVHIDLQRDEEDILAAFKQKTRYNIRLAGRRDVTVRAGTDSDFPEIADMYLATATRDEFAVRPRDYYLDAWGSFYKAGMAHPFIAEFDGQPISAVIIIKSHNRAYYMYGASTNLERQRMPNYLLQWESIRWAKKIGCHLYDFWGAPNEFVESDPLWGVWRFKRGFNGGIVRHLGAWDFPVKPFWYMLYTEILPRYLAILRSRGTI